MPSSGNFWLGASRVMNRLPNSAASPSVSVLAFLLTAVALRWHPSGSGVVLEDFLGADFAPRGSCKIGLTLTRSQLANIPIMKRMNRIMSTIESRELPLLSFGVGDPPRALRMWLWT